MSIANLRAAVTHAGGTPVHHNRVELYRELITAWGATPTQFTIPGLLHEAITAKLGSSTHAGIVPLLRDLVTTLGGTPSSFNQDDLEAQIATLA